MEPYCKFEKGIVDKSTTLRYEKVRKSDLAAQAEVTDIFEAAKRLVLSHTKNSFIVPVEFVFSSADILYLVSPFVHGGELLALLEKEKSFGLDAIRLYGSEIVCALEYLHDLGNFPGLRPENILLDYTGHVLICDFGLWVGMKLDPKRYERDPFVAPEIRLGQVHTAAADWWILGIVLAEMLTDLPSTWSDEEASSMTPKCSTSAFQKRSIHRPRICRSSS